MSVRCTRQMTGLMQQIMVCLSREATCPPGDFPPSAASFNLRQANGCFPRCIFHSLLLRCLRLRRSRRERLFIKWAARWRSSRLLLRMETMTTQVLLLPSGGSIHMYVCMTPARLLSWDGSDYRTDPNQLHHLPLFFQT